MYWVRYWKQVAKITTISPLSFWYVRLRETQHSFKGRSLATKFLLDYVHDCEDNTKITFRLPFSCEVVRGTGTLAGTFGTIATYILTNSCPMCGAGRENSKCTLIWGMVEHRQNTTGRPDRMPTGNREMGRMGRTGQCGPFCPFLFPVGILSGTPVHI